MKKIYFTPSLLVIAALLSACASTSKTTSSLDQTRSDYVVAQNNPLVANYAALELKQAGDALGEANAAASKRESNEKIDKLAYLAKQKIALAQEVAKRKQAETEVVNSDKERDQVRLVQRTQEADKAKLNAQQSMDVAQRERGNAIDAQNQTQIAQMRTAQLQAQLAELSAKMTDRGLVITLGDVLFGTDLARLNSEGISTTQKLADILQQNPQRVVLIEGFADSTGSTAHNQELSERRANTVRGALLGMGISRERIEIHGYGESYPVAENDSAQNRQLNRRVEIILSDENGKIAQR